MMGQGDALGILPLTRDRWADFEALMGPKGGYGGCWCMLWRLGKADFTTNAGEGNRAAMKKLAAGERPPGLLAYWDGHPVGWISVAPRRDFPRLDNSRVLKAVDEQDVWSVSCFLIARAYRRQGLAARLLEAACDFVRAHGGKVIEGYPIAPSKNPYPTTYAWTGFAEVFSRVGFVEVARRSSTRPIMRKELQAESSGESAYADLETSS